MSISRGSWGSLSLGIALTLLVACSSAATIESSAVTIEPGEPSTSSTLSTRTTIVAEWEIFESPEEIAAGSDAVVVGVVGSEYGRYPLFEPGVDAEPALTKILHVVQVRDVIAMREGLADRLAPGTEILVSYSDLGGFVDNITPLREGEQLVLFLVAATFKSPDLPSVDGWEPLSSDSGIFVVDGDRVVARTSVGPLAGEVFDRDAFVELVEDGLLATPSPPSDSYLGTQGGDALTSRMRRLSPGSR
jgi:hypothetical protein